MRARMVRLLVDYFGEDDRRIEHALRVLFHSERLLLENNSADPEIVIACALFHDVGIKVSEKKLGYNDGNSQEKFGPEAAETLLRSLGFAEKKIKIAKDIIGNHHSPSRYDYPELKILKEADRIVNDSENI